MRVGTDVFDLDIIPGDRIVIDGHVMQRLRRRIEIGIGARGVIVGGVGVFRNFKAWGSNAR